MPFSRYAIPAAQLTFRALGVAKPLRGPDAVTDVAGTPSLVSDEMWAVIGPLFGRGKAAGAWTTAFKDFN